MILNSATIAKSPDPRDFNVVEYPSYIKSSPISPQTQMMTTWSEHKKNYSSNNEKEPFEMKNVKTPFSPPI